MLGVACRYGLSFSLITIALIRQRLIFQYNMIIIYLQILSTNTSMVFCKSKRENVFKKQDKLSTG